MSEEQYNQLIGAVRQMHHDELSAMYYYADQIVDIMTKQTRRQVNRTIGASLVAAGMASAFMGWAWLSEEKKKRNNA